MLVEEPQNCLGDSRNENIFLLHLFRRSIFKNFESFKIFFLTLNFSFSIIYFKTCSSNSNVDSSSYKFLNYVSAHQVRPHHKGTGVSIYIHKKFKFKFKNYLSVNCQNIELAKLLHGVLSIDHPTEKQSHSKTL